MMATGSVTATPIPRHAPPRAAVYYPDSDGKPMAETDLHRDIMLDVIFMLQRWFAGQSDDVYVSGNILVYYVEGDPRRSVSPDALVIKGVRQYRRDVVKLWEEGRAPQVVFEVTSSSTRREDTGRKRLLYAQLGVREYYMYDPTGDYLDPR
ncbi:MAG: Uma2 family endonuclease, partial [Chloroflexota bacterium]|nr:Uma2 family endonuclease [Chloroflexota bacterium]